MVIGRDFNWCMFWRSGSLLDIQLNFPKNRSTPSRRSLRFTDQLNQPRFLVLTDLRFHCVDRFGHFANSWNDQFDVPKFNRRNRPLEIGTHLNFQLI